MANRISGLTIVLVILAGAAGVAVTLLLTPSTIVSVGQRARTAEGRPDFSGIWQTNNEAYWDLEAHEARPGAVTQPGVYPEYDFARVAAAPVAALGAAAGVPASLGVVEGDGKIPYKPETAATKRENSENWIDRDPELRCYLPGVPRAMYMPYPFQIVQSTSKIQMIYTFANAARTIHLDEVEAPPDYSYMGHSVGRWEGDALVVDVTGFNGKNWFDRAGNFHSASMHLVERFTQLSPDAIHYEAAIDDPEIFTQPWRIAMPIYRRLEPNAQLIEYPCIEFAEEFMYGHVRKQQLVKRWEGETMTIEITRKVPPGDRFYEWYQQE